MFGKVILLCALMALAGAPVVSARAEEAVVLRAEDLATDYRCIEAAREALIAKYGHTRATLGLFDETVRFSSSDDRPMVRFTPIQRPEELGEYAVVLEAGKPPEASWTLEGQAGAWGRAEIEEAVAGDWRFRAALMEIAGENGDISAVGLEAWAALAPLLSPLSSWAQDIGMPALPGPDDMPYAEAMRLFRAAIDEKYGLSPEALNGYADYGTFTRTENGWYYALTLSAEEGAAEDSLNRFTGGVVPGEAAYVAWQVSPERRTLPAGNLGAYTDAVQEYISDEAILSLSHDRRATLSERILSDTGLLVRADGLRYVAPQAGFLPEAEAVEAAKIAFVAECGMTDAFFALYDLQTALLTDETDTSFWQVRLVPHARYRDAVLMADLLGEYVARVEARTGAVESARWARDDGTPPTRDPSFPALVGRLHAVYREDATGQTMRYDVLSPIVRDFEEAGYTVPWFAGWRTEPDEDALSEDAARALVAEWLVEKYGLSETECSQARWKSQYVAESWGPPRWHIDIHMAQPGHEDFFSLEIDAFTGEPYVLRYVLQGNG